ncbi:hypothetical protein ACX27_09115 [Nostoc piscinale CENA21]|uniref:Uncharacterized protein n=1 Tax=Nostoc piscinale CENA21 TaxID=224013 RepID=A0A0M3V4Z1_9NOSO|nr:hypothetical protein [Nostoc piscinale]ALF52973.1 hypothetical protein ACX27_09115 [Nostoc piscinale CENA21]
MEASSLSPEFYEMQAALAANELDFELHLSACEAEAKSVINGSFEPMPQAETQPQQSTNSVYNLNEILDAFS